MSEFLLEVGDELAVSVFHNGVPAGAVIIKRPSTSVVDSSIYVSGDEERLFFVGALEQCSFVLEAADMKKDLGKLIKDAIAKLEDQIGEESELPPSPTDDIGDIPF